MELWSELPYEVILPILNSHDSLNLLYAISLPTLMVSIWVHT
jgi:hypothetical protein